MSLAEYKKWRELEKRVEARRKQLVSIFSVDNMESFVGDFNTFKRASKIVDDKLREEFPEWFVDDPRKD